MEFGVLFKILFGASLLINVALFAEQHRTNKEYDELVDEYNFVADKLEAMENKIAELRRKAG